MLKGHLLASGHMDSAVHSHSVCSPCLRYRGWKSQWNG